MTSKEIPSETQFEAIQASIILDLKTVSRETDGLYDHARSALTRRSHDLLAAGIFPSIKAASPISNRRNLDYVVIDYPAIILENSGNVLSATTLFTPNGNIRELGSYSDYTGRGPFPVLGKGNQVSKNAYIAYASKILGIFESILDAKLNS